MITITKKSALKSNFLIKPRDFFSTSIVLPKKTIDALQQASSIIQNNSQNNYTLVVTRGYISWRFWRRLRALLAKFIFRLFFSENKFDVDVLFSANGHDDGLSVDVSLYDTKNKKLVRFLPQRNIFISRTKANIIQQKNKELFILLSAAMNEAGFIIHSDPREKLQSHFRLAQQT